MTLALEKRTVITPKAEPAQIFGYRVAEFRPAARAIQIFDPKEKGSTVRATTLLRLPKRDRVANVQITSRRWSETAAISQFVQNADFDLKRRRRNLKSPA